MLVQEPEVSILIPSRDRPECLPRTLASALGQQDVKAEIIIIDDGSRVPVAELLESAASRKVRVIRREEAEGVSLARNAGIAAARGQWLAFLDDDDLWAPTKVRRSLDAATKQHAHFAFSGGVAIDRQGRVAFVDDGPSEQTSLYYGLLAANVLPFGASNVVAKTSCVRDLDGFDPELSTLADWDFNIRLSAAGPGGVVPERLVAWMLHGTNMHQAETRLAQELSYIERKHAAARVAAGVRLDREHWLRWRSETRRRAGDRRGTAAGYWQLGIESRDARMLGRGMGMWLGGERALRIARRLRPGRDVRETPPPLPTWLEEALTCEVVGRDDRGTT